MNETSVENSQPGMGLNETRQTSDGGWEAFLPSNKMLPGAGVLFEKRQFASEEEAQAAIEQGRGRQRLMEEWDSLSGSFTRHLYRIERSLTGFAVITPSLYHPERGFFVGEHRREFTDWDEAKAAYLESRRDGEDLIHDPIVDLELGDGSRIAFSNYEGFRPSAAPTKETYPIPVDLQKYILAQEKIAGTRESAGTYQETIKNEDWERELFDFVKKYLRSKEGRELKQQLKIEELTFLTPAQAIELTNQMVLNLTRYRRSDLLSETENRALVERVRRGEQIDVSTEADRSSAIQLLEDGMQNKSNPKWKGNGVCRNFASMVKAVFECLKASQREYSQLRNTYCLYEGDDKTYKPSRVNEGDVINRAMAGRFEPGHAWNTFVTVSHSGRARATISDVTWAKRDIATGKVNGIDHTLLRMEPVVNDVAKNMAESPKRDEQLMKVLSYYGLHLERTLTPGSEYMEAEGVFFASRALEIIMKNNFYRELPTALVDGISDYYLKAPELVNDLEFRALWSLYKTNPNVPFRRIAKAVLGIEKPTMEAFIIQKDEELQKVVFDAMKAHGKFQRYLETKSKFRARAREIMPDLFVDFDPDNSEQDKQELIFLVKDSRYIKISMLDRRTAEQIYKIARGQLENVDSATYNKEYAGLSDWQIIRHFDKIYSELRKV